MQIFGKVVYVCGVGGRSVKGRICHPKVVSTKKALSPHPKHKGMGKTEEEKQEEGGLQGENKAIVCAVCVGCDARYDACHVSL
jgi:hypothetical protein